MKKLVIAALSIAVASSLSAFGAAAEDKSIDLKDGGKVVLQKDGKTFHTDSKGKRMRMKNGVVMEAKDGQKYMMKSDVMWQQITEKGTLAPNR